MPRVVGFLAGLTLVLFATPCPAQSQTTEELIAGMLQAIPFEDPAERSAFAHELHGSVREIADRLGRGEPSWRTARRLHRLMHKQYLLTYDREADDLRLPLRDGRFNCMSASLFYGLVANELGFETRIVETPGHLFLRVGNGIWAADIETTSRYGFDAGYQQRAARFAETAQERYLRWHHRHAPPRVQVREPFWPVELGQSSGLIWLNRAWVALDGDDPGAVARNVRRAAVQLPGLVDRAPGVELLLRRAWSLAYESGRFGLSLEVSAVLAELLPDETSTHDRVVASASRTIRQLTEADDPRAAAAMLDAVPVATLPPDERRRIERTLCPAIASAAMRRGDLELSHAMAVRYADAEPDPIEAQRLLRWVRYRAELATRSSESGRAGVEYGPTYQ